MFETLKKHLANIPGWRTDRKVVVIESDDWGAIRIPTRRAYEKLLKSGINVDQSVYDSKDCLASRKDFESLFEVLSNHQSGNVKPIFTFNTVLGNPYFEKIEEGNFEAYYHEHLFDSYKRYVGDDLKETWFHGIDQGVVKPQFHAREHLNTTLWLQALKNNHEKTRVAFGNNFYGLKTDTPSQHQNHYLAAHHPTGKKDFEEKVNIIKDGLDMFEEIFGFRSASFIACNYVWPTELEGELAKMGIRILQGQRAQLDPDIKSGKKKVKRHYTGQKNNYGQVYLVRNCKFEPAENPDKDWVNSCLRDIQTAFRWKKPAIISSHRINYVSGMNKENRSNGLKKLDRLFKGIIKQWPEVEFMSTDQLGKLVLG